MDVYFTKDYASCYCNVESSDPTEVCEFVHTSNTGTVYYVFLKRKIINARFRLNNYYDIITPYGYGGPVVTQCIQGGQAALASEFSEQFTAYCMDNNIVSEFVRFHPIERNHETFAGHYKPTYMRKTVCVELSGDNAMGLLPQKCRNTVNKSIRNGVEVWFDASGEYLDEFYRLYTLTMDKSNASSFYFFEKQFFEEKVWKLRDRFFFVHALKDSKIISSAMFLHSDKYVHYHLSGTDPNEYHLSANNLIIASAIQRGIDSGKKCLHLGGGTTNLDNDPLLKFKKSFSKNGLCDFYVGMKIYDRDVYDGLCLDAGDGMGDYFPGYRVRANPRR